MIVETRILGRKTRPLDGWSVPALPETGGGGDGGVTLRDLITRIVRAEVKAFGERERARRFIRVLAEREIAEGAARGRIDPGGRPAAAESIDEDAAVAAALQGFEDGLYLVVLDGVEQRDLDAQVYPTNESRMIFLRLTFLAGA
jgi:hypothetical protein